MKKYCCLILFAALVCLMPVSAQQTRATFDDGRTVILRSDGTWFFVDRSARVDGQAVIFNGKVVILQKNGKWSATTETRAVPTALYAGGSGGAAIRATAAWHTYLSQHMNKLITADGNSADAQRLTNKKFVLLYFSAYWCGPCRAFTPKLVNFYNENGGGDKFEILFVSHDDSKEAMAHYMRTESMPWVGLDYKSPSRAVLDEKYSGPGIPCLVMLDEHDNVVSHSYVNNEYVGPSRVVEDLMARLRMEQTR